MRFYFFFLGIYFSLQKSWENFGKSWISSANSTNFDFDFFWWQFANFLNHKIEKKKNPFKDY